MVQVLLRSQSNIQTKYVLEKVNLKKILQALHREVNETKTPLKLKGGMDSEAFIFERKSLSGLAILEG